jgi:hypothetical protein
MKCTAKRFINLFVMFGRCGFGYTIMLCSWLMSQNLFGECENICNGCCVAHEMHCKTFYNFILMFGRCVVWLNNTIYTAHIQASVFGLGRGDLHSAHTGQRFWFGEGRH